MSHQLRTIILKIDKMFFVRVHATRAYDDVANNKNNETISNLKLIQYNLKNKQATSPPSCQETTRATMVVLFLKIYAKSRQCQLVSVSKQNESRIV